MNSLDIIVIIPLVWGAFKGFKNGLISEGGSLAAIIIGVWASVSFSETGGNLVSQYLGISNNYKQIVAFSLIFLLVVILSFFITKIISNFFQSISLTWLDKLCGILFGAAKYAVILAFLFFILQTLIQKYSTQKIETFENSMFFKPLANSAQSLLEGNIVLPKIDLPSPSFDDSMIK